jgi:mRNA interferase MazF
MRVSRGDVILIPVPYVGAPGSKLRPAVVVQNDILNKALNETVIVSITTNLAHVHRPQQMLIDVSTPDGQATGLIANSVVRCDRLRALPQADVRRTIGKLSPVSLARLDACLEFALGIP